MANPHGTPIWYELQTPDPDAATTFYEAVMGWTIEGRPIGDMDYRMIGAAGGHAGAIARWDAAAPGAGASPGWLMYIGVDDVDASVAALVAAGGTVSNAAFDFPGVGRIAKVADPQGIAFYLMRAAAEGDSDVFSTTAVGRVSWNELTTSDLAATTRFYDGLCGWQVTGSMPMGGDLGDYCFVSLGDADRCDDGANGRRTAADVALLCPRRRYRRRGRRNRGGGRYHPARPSRGPRRRPYRDGVRSARIGVRRGRAPAQGSMSGTFERSITRPCSATPDVRRVRR